MKALGFIETYGMLSAVEAADAMLKAAEVRLLDKSLASGGLVTITVTGEVAAVKAAVDAGVASVERINKASLVSKHVIARPDAELSKIVPKAPTPVGGGCGSCASQAETTAESHKAPQSGTTVSAPKTTTSEPVAVPAKQDSPAQEAGKEAAPLANKPVASKAKTPAPSKKSPKKKGNK